LKLEIILASNIQRAVLGICSPEESLKQAQAECDRYFLSWENSGNKIANKRRVI
jgi:hypothetical protein